MLNELTLSWVQRIAALVVTTPDRKHCAVPLFRLVDVAEQPGVLEVRVHQARQLEG